MKLAKKKSRTWNAVQEYRRLMELYQSDIDDKERVEIEKELFGIIDNIGEFADTFAGEIGRLRAGAVAARAEGTALSQPFFDLSELRKSRADSLEGWLGRVLFKFQKGEKLETALHEFSFTDSIETVVMDEGKLPVQYWRTPEPKAVPDKTKIRERILKTFLRRGMKTKEIVAALDVGTVSLLKVPGAVIVPKHNLTIK